jgi:HTH-type transcriptional regulator/antitoxin HigA
MKEKPQWFLIETEQEYAKAVARYNKIKNGTAAKRKERLLLAYLIQNFNDRLWDMPDTDPVKIIKLRMADLGYKAADLVLIYGDKGTVSKVLNYKQHLSLTMIRRFSELLHLPVSALVKEYELVGS